MIESLRDIAKKDAELVDDKVKLLDALTKLTERNEQLLVEQQALKEKYEGEYGTQSELVAALEEQNALLKRVVVEKEDGINKLESKIASMEATNPGTVCRILTCLIEFILVLLSSICTVSLYLWISDEVVQDNWFWSVWSSPSAFSW